MRLTRHFTNPESVMKRALLAGLICILAVGRGLMQTPNAAGTAITIATAVISPIFFMEISLSVGPALSPRAPRQRYGCIPRSVPASPLPPPGAPSPRFSADLARRPTPARGAAAAGPAGAGGRARNLRPRRP